MTVSATGGRGTDREERPAVASPSSRPVPARLPVRYLFTEDWASPRFPVWRELTAHLRGRPHVRALEIGSFEGRSALFWLEDLCTHKTASVTCVDPWKDPHVYRTFVHNVHASGRPEQIRIIRTESWQALPHLGIESFDLIYVDGSHEGRDVLEDAVLSFRRLRPGGLLIFDDYLWTNPANARERPPRPAIDAFLDLYADRLEFLHRDYQIAVKKRPTTTP